MALDEEKMREYEDPMKDMVAGIEGFIDMNGDIVEEPDDLTDDSISNSSLDEDEVQDALQSLLGIPRDPKVESKLSASCSESEREEEDSNEDTSIRELMADMDRELQGTKVKASHQNELLESEDATDLETEKDDQTELSRMRANLASQLFKSMDSQEGNEGPASLLLSSLGITRENMIR
jgi:hypothetical protein